ncbi:unnamed protein product [Penicillium salamii]|uniref:Wax synthase domain-containing protein n=1 Tax=Penicillium salamii TaxID=1612424 RepID=A0A9W4JNK2_9EURO|nr:unnamed protein product [Penicillium salamii]CAG8211543.1 unnamed protein product [Penicillium salamii]CAG8225618.1 unnamed protein product [Penicillium salamii]CAG8232272.1 unnamed protein product [Penicillium salamii]CAG8245382.1 unnamed protein product [Penicillium salamii]
MADPRYGSYRDLAKHFESELDGLIEQGVYKPIFLYHVVIIHALPMIGLVIPRSRGGHHIRKVLFAICVGIAIDIFQNRRAVVGGNGYMLGLMTAWWLIWTATLFIFTDLERDFQRIERNPSAEQVQNTHIIQKASVEDKQLNSEVSPSNQEKSSAFIWQSYPPKFSHRLEWAAGLFFNLRGPEWNWRAPHLGPLPQSIHTQLQTGFTEKIKAQADPTYPSGKQRFQAAFRKFCISYLILDVLKVIILMPDPYFQGIAPSNSVSPPPFPFFYFPSIAVNPALAQLCRCMYSAVSVYFALEFVTPLNPIFFLGLSLAFPNAAQKLTAAPLGASWLYSEAFGPFIQPVLDQGLAGCWGKWWHQLFRNGFMSAARWILSLLPDSLTSHLNFRRVVYVAVSFCISGLIHACGSRTQIPGTHPVSGPFLFFALQGVAVMAEQFFKTAIFPRLPLGGTPRWVRRTANFLFVYCWLMTSGGLIADDFARGGLWLMEPIPVSPLRGLGFGLQGEGWWCWREPWFRYWSDGSYWGSGIRVL